MVRFQIFYSTNQIEARRALAPAGRSGRVKALAIALLLASAFVGFLIAALTLGTILAMVLIILVAVVFTLALFKWAIGRLRA